MQKQLTKLKKRLQQASDLTHAAALLNWDQSTYMPPGGAPARGRQSALLSQLSQEKLTDKKVGKLLDKLEPWAAEQPAESDAAALVRITRREYDRMTKIPPKLLGELVSHMSTTYQIWAKARPENDFATVAPYLEKTVVLSRQIADCFPGYDHIADPLIDFSDFGIGAEQVKTIFAALRKQLVPLVEGLTAQPEADDSCLKQPFPEDKQLAFGLDIGTQYGYDLQRGRQDKTHHPFMTKFSLGDVRITTRVKEDDLSEALFSTLHEVGHALYEQGINMEYEASPLGGGTSAGVHESQSRLWENLVGRSRGFWEYQYPKLQAVFPKQLGDVSLDTFYRAINKVSRSLIRTDADEVTYNLHVMIRFDLELALLEGSLAVKDLPEAWHARYESDLGLRAPSDVDGCLQDVHWYSGLVGGAFQGYTLGNILSAQFFDAAVAANPSIPEEIRAGKYATLHSWLTHNIYTHGAKYTTNELVERVTGGPLAIDPYITYLRRKYGELYALEI